MPVSLILPFLLGGALLIPILTDDEEDTPTDGAIKGTPGDDPDLQGTSADDLIFGYMGNDIIRGNGGSDELFGGGGNDEIYGGELRDFISGGADNDILYGFGGGDGIEGGGGNDTIYAGNGDDFVRGGAGNDTIYGGTDDGVDLLRGEDDDDDVFLWGNEGRAFGGQGNDDLVLVTGQGSLDGVADSNTYYALANDDDEQETLAVIKQFFLNQDLTARDAIVMTIDTANADLEDEPIVVTVTEGTFGGDSGYFIEIGFENVVDPMTYEASRVFVTGTSVPIETIASAVKVDVTVNASLTTEGAQATFDQVSVNAAAPASTVPAAPPTAT
jgi:Ca2+-binding RTX toxin-like protein